MGRPLRLLYAAGPGNVIGTYRHWKEGRDDPSQVSVTYSGQFYDQCRDLGACGYVIASCRPAGRLRDGQFILEHRPIYWEDRRGARKRRGQVWSSFRLIVSGLVFREDVTVVSNGSGHWFPLTLLPLLGLQVVPSLHCVLWPKGRPRWVNRLIQRLNAPFFARAALAILSAHGMSRQVAR